MQSKKLFVSSIMAGLLLITGTLWLSTAQPANAQCGSQASSCKNCHEVQGQDPVNTDGTAWHQSHAFGDFCYICHAGNNQAMDKEAAHIGMASPLSDVKAACQQCHPDDVMDRARKYATVLGTQIDTGGGASAVALTTHQGQAANSDQPSGSDEVPVAASGGIPGMNAMVVNDPNTVDYVQHYEETVLGKRPTNWGNVILLVLIGAIVVGGGSFVLRREGWVRITFVETKQVEREYPSDVVEMLPEIARLKPAARKSLRLILAKQPVAGEFLISLDKLTQDDPSNQEFSGYWLFC